LDNSAIGINRLMENNMFGIYSTQVSENISRH